MTRREAGLAWQSHQDTVESEELPLRETGSQWQRVV